MNYEEAIAKIEENYTTILDHEKIVKKIIEHVAHNDQELALAITQVVKLSDYQKIIHKVKDEFIANIKELKNEDIDFEDVESKLVTAAIEEISDEVLRACEVNKITQEFKGTLNYERIISETIELYTKSASSEEFKAKMAKEIEEYVKPSDYQKIVDEAQEEIIVKTNQNDGLNYQDIMSNIEVLIESKIINKIMLERKKCREKLEKEVEETECEINKIKKQKNMPPIECIKLFNHEGNSRRQTTKSFSQKVLDRFGKLSEKLKKYRREYDLLKYNTSSINNEAKEDNISKLQETIIEIIDLYKKCPDHSESYKLVPRVFGIINSNISSDSIWKGFVIDNFSKIIEFGFKNEEPLEDLIRLIERIANKLKERNGNKLPLHDAMESHYLQVVEQHREVCGQLGKLKQRCSNEGLYKEFYTFIDFIYSSKKEKEEQDRKEKLQREKAERELLEEESKETGGRLKQSQRKKKKNKSRVKNGNNSKNDKVTNEPEIQNSKEEQNKEPEDEEVKALREELKELIALLFSDERSKQFEDKVNKAIENHEKNLKIEASSIGDEKIKGLYVIKSDFHLRCAILNISHYNKQYGKIVKQTKDNFGTKKFSPKHNKHITSHLPDIASRVQYIDTNLKEVLSVLDKMTTLVYKDNCQESDERCLQIISEENYEWLNRFLDHLKALGEWHSNKINYVQEHNIKNNTKTAQERKEEKEALEAIESCVDSLDTFISKSDYVQDLNNNQSVKSDKESPLEYYGPCQSWEYYGPHQQWCALSNVSIEGIHKLSKEIQGCTCYENLF